jgi:hypothetical protein
VEILNWREFRSFECGENEIEGHLADSSGPWIGKRDKANAEKGIVRGGGESFGDLVRLECRLEDEIYRLNPRTDPQELEVPGESCGTTSSLIRKFQGEFFTVKSLIRRFQGEFLTEKSVEPVTNSFEGPDRFAESATVHTKSFDELDGRRPGGIANRRERLVEKESLGSLKESFRDSGEGNEVRVGRRAC